MQIDRYNYEAILIDYQEQKLNRVERKSVEAFLIKNPDIADEFELLELTESLSKPSPLKAINKNELLKSHSEILEISDSNFDEFCIAFHENDLDEASIQKLNNYIQNNPAKRHTFELYGKINFQPDKAIVYPEKKELKKTLVRPLIVNFRRFSAGIAALLIGFLVWYNLPQSKESIPQQITNAKSNEIITSDSSESIHFVKEEKKVKFFPKKIEKRNLQAVIDTSDSRRQDKIVLAELQKLTPITETVNVSTKPFRPRSLYQTASNTLRNSPINEERKPITETLSSIKDIEIKKERIFWNAMDAGIRGFNRLTESEYALNTLKDNSGKITELEIGAGNFELIRKIKKNIQN